MSKPVFAALLVAMSVFSFARPARAAEGVLKDKYHAVQVDRFDIQKGVQFPADYLLTLQEEILKQLQKSQKFKEVLRPGENPVDASAPVLRLTGTVTHFKPGSRAKRYVLGRLAGSTEIFAHVAFLDRSTGETVIAEEVTGIMAGGFIGGESLNVTRDFAKKVVTSTTLVMEKRLPAPGEPATASAASGPQPAVVDRHVVAISSRDFAGAQQKLNAEAAAGFHVASFAATGGKTADVTMEKSATPAQVFEYRLLRGRYPQNLQKDLNKGADDGFRLCPHTLSGLGGLSLIIEKPPGPAKTRYQYLVHHTMRVSSAGKDIQKDQSEGYVLVETTELPGMHIVVLEKAVEKGSD